MRTLLRVLLLASIALLAARAWRVTAYEADFREGTRAYERGAYALAVERFEAARERSDADPLLWTWLGDSAAAAHLNPPVQGWERDRESALLDRIWSGYAGAVLRSPRDAWSWSGLADAALRRARVADRTAVLDLEELERRRSGTADPWRAAALGAAKIAIDLKPSGFLELDVLGSVYESLGQTDAAREAYVRSARMMPSPAIHAWGTGRRVLAPSLYAGIRDGLREGLSRAPSFERSALHLGVGRFARVHGDLRTAEAEIRSALGAALTDHDRYQALRALAEVLELEARWAEAATVLTSALELEINPAADRLQRGGVYHRLGRRAEACGDLADALRGRPDDSGLRTFAAGACEEAGELQLAERLLREGFTSPAQNPVLARGLLDFYVRQGRRNTAVGLSRAWARDYPEHPEFERWAATFASPAP